MGSHSATQTAWQLHRSGDTDQGISLLRESLLVESNLQDREQLLHAQAHILIDAGRAAEAVEILQSAIGLTLGPDDLPVVEFNSPMLLEDLFTATAIAGVGDQRPVLLALIDVAQAEGDAEQALEYAAILIMDHRFHLLAYAAPFAESWLAEAELQGHEAHARGIAARIKELQNAS